MADPIANFMAMTDCKDESEAIQYLSMVDFDLSQAVAVYMEANPPSSAPVVNSSASAAAPSAGGDDQGFVSRQQATRLVDMDPAGPGDMGFHVPPELIGGGGGFHAPGRMPRLDDIMRRPGAGTNPQGGPRGRAGGGGGLYGGDFGDEFGDDGDGFQPYNEAFFEDAGPGPARPEQPPVTALDNLFRPPSFAHSGSFKDVCHEALRKKKWVMLNVISRGDLDSGNLQRDIWRDDLVKAMVPALVVLYQATNDSTDGETVINAYHLRRDQLPFLAIVNPLTRAIAREFPLNRFRNTDATQGLSAQEFLNQLTAFTDRHGEPEGAPEMDRPAGTPPPAPVATSSSAPPVDMPTDAFDEDPDLQIALALSAAEQSAKPSVPETVDVDGGDSMSQQQQFPSGGSRASAVVVDSPVRPDVAPAPPVAVAAPVPAPAPAPEPVDITSYRRSTGEDGALRLRFKLAGGAEDEVLTNTLPLHLLVKYLAQLMTKEGEPPVDPSTVELLTGFPPKRLTFDLSDESTTVGQAGLRNNDMVTPHIK